MSRLKRSVLISAIFLMAIVFSGWIGLSQPQPSVQLTTTPAVSQIRPFEAEATNLQSPVQVMLQAMDSAGLPVEDAQIHLQILTPPRNPWLPTDFPIVEGTTLLDMEALAPKGELQFQQMLPVRGTYRLLVNVKPIAPAAFVPFQQTLTLSVAENGVKLQNFAILAVILLTVGLVGGWVIGGKQPIQPGEVSPQRVQLLLSGAIVVAIATLLFVNINAELAQSHLAMAMSHPTEDVPPLETPAQMQSQGLEMQLSGDLSATVGQPATLNVSVMDANTKQPVSNVSLKVAATQLENNWVAFAYEGIPDSTGNLTWQQQFFDGAPHKIEVEVAPQATSTRQFQPFQVAQTLSVQGVAPPLSVRLISLTYMIGLVILGFLLGLGIQHRHKQGAFMRQLN
ncbi:MAG TPA: hypothetical protein IGS53_03490 [Leptolyngbyaceae cyanobacterium M33_DOE_097]|uniref:Uncharacterized protein n=1 Tax=Oscillatoriales cyanobacterium SpSt-418 TaxID=2282169 RepID=A0A7C3PJT8_9CYAN|nr:hypothetical protein [Leptolyngbyaceae cyanobacterium M33_DOE_097]